MSEPRDPLRALWDAVAAPAAHRPLADEDAATRDAIAWLQGAYARVAPAAAAPRARLAPRPVHAWARRLALVAAAAVLLLIVRASWNEPRPGRDLPAEARMPPPATAPEIQVLTSDAQRLEMRSGSVRLILLHPQPRNNP